MWTALALGLFYREKLEADLPNRKGEASCSCLVSREIHIEVADELNSAAFINAFRRFIALRGPVKEIRYDRGTNFIGAISDLGISAQFCENAPVAKQLSTLGTIRRFNPPHASHFGGCWERMIGVSRRILDAMILKEENRLTHESLVTLVAEICAIINSRPLLSVSKDPDHPEVLSPSVLLTHKQTHIKPVLSNFNAKDMIRHQWKLVPGLSEEFWAKWSKEYMHTLQSRQKWHVPTDSLRVGDAVLMKDDDLHRSAIIIQYMHNANRKFVFFSVLVDLSCFLCCMFAISCNITCMSG